MFNNLKLTTLLLMLATLIACGGGSGDSDDPDGSGDNDKKLIKTLRIATFGDSTANVSPLEHDIQVFKAELSKPLSKGLIESNKYQVPFYYPAAYLVANGGISGENTTRMLARDEKNPTPQRKATEDIIALKPQVILFRGGSINNLPAVTADNMAVMVEDIYKEHITLIEKFTIDGVGIPVLDAGILGYSLPKGSTHPTGYSKSDPDQVRLALVALNKRYKDYAKTNDKVTFIDPMGVVSDLNGRYFDKMTRDGIHPSVQGALAMAKAEADALRKLFGPSEVSSFEKGGSNLYPEISSTETKQDKELFSIWSNKATRTTSIETIDNKKYQFLSLESNSANGSGGVKVSLSSVIDSLEMGKTYGISADIIIENLSADVSGGIEFDLSTRLDLNNNEKRYVLESLSGTFKDFNKQLKGRIEFQPLKLESVLGTRSVFTISISKLSLNTKIRVGITALKIVELPSQ